jgi:hypothetical protein
MIIILLLIAIVLILLAPFSGGLTLILLVLVVVLILLILFGKILFGTTDVIYSAFNEKNCPYCKEAIKSSAIKCKHCGSELKISKSENLNEDEKWINYIKEIQNIQDKQYLSHCYATYQVKKDFDNAINMVNFKYKITHINFHEKKVRLVINKNSVEKTTSELINMADDFCKEIKI